MTRVAITGLGLASAVGLTARASAAAIRAGIARFAECGDVQVAADPDGLARRSAVVARAPVTTEELLALALADCRRGLTDAELDVAHRSVTTFDGYRAERGIGHTAMLRAVMDAADGLRRGERRHALVAAVDSFADRASLAALGERGALKSAMRPDGMMPGEAAAAVVLELEASARERGAHVLAWLTGWGQGELTDTLRRVAGASRVGLCVADLNGERQRSQAFALAASRVLSRQTSLWHPADCVGDCGQVAGAIGLVVGVSALDKRYAPEGAVVVTATDDDGASTVATLEMN